MKAALTASRPVAEQVDGQKGEANVLVAKAPAPPERKHAATQTTGEPTSNKKRKLEDPEGPRPQELEINPLAALVAEMQDLVEAHLAAKADFKRKVDNLAQQILLLKKF